MTARDWSPAEIAATVASYLEMLRLEVLGQPYSKTVFRDRLLDLLNDRTSTAVEYKHQNISAVMMRLGLRPIKGYQPAKNYQHALIAEVQAQLASSPSIIEQVLAEALQTPDAAAVGALDVAWSPIPRIVLPDARASVRTVRHYDYASVEASNRKLGNGGEEAVVELERRRLHGAGKRKLAESVEHVSKTRGDGLGYDILSFEESGKERLIEVKTTKSRAETPFFVSRNELQVSQEQAHVFHLIRVFNFGPTPRWYHLPGSIDATCELQESTFLAVPKAG
jgi:hypothetical protein